MTPLSVTLSSRTGHCPSRVFSIDENPKQRHKGAFITGCRCRAAASPAAQLPLSLLRRITNAPPGLPSPAGAGHSAGFSFQRIRAGEPAGCPAKPLHPLPCVTHGQGVTPFALNPFPQPRGGLRANPPPRVAVSPGLARVRGLPRRVTARRLLRAGPGDRHAPPASARRGQVTVGAARAPGPVTPPAGLERGPPRARAAERRVTAAVAPTGVPVLVAGLPGQPPPSPPATVTPAGSWRWSQGRRAPR